MDNVMELESHDERKSNESQVSPVVGSQLCSHETEQLRNPDHQSLTSGRIDDECMATETWDRKISSIPQAFEVSVKKINPGLSLKNESKNKLDVNADLKSCRAVETTKESFCNSGIEKPCGTKSDCLQTCFKHCENSNKAAKVNNNLQNNTTKDDSTEAESTSSIGNYGIIFSNDNHLSNISSEGVITICIHHEAVTSSQVSLCEKCHRIEKADDLSMETENNLSNNNKFVSNTNSSDDPTVVRSDSFVVISNNNALPETESIVSSNCSLAQLRTYGSEESLNEEPSMLTQHLIEGKHRNQDFEKDSDSDSSSSSSSTSILISDSTDSDGTSDDEYENYTSLARKPAKVKGELELEDLPPIQDLKISMPEEACTPIGKVFQIVDRLVVVQSLKDVPAYDLDTVLFVQGGKPLGKIFDVFGPVIEPYYCIRFNSNDHIKEKNISLNQIIYSAPKSKHTRYVFLAQLLKLKGSDASWKDDIEPPKIYLDYSDDEQEQKARKKRSRNRKTRSVVSDPDEPARKRHSAYERRMNERNSQLSAVRNNQSYCRNRAQSFNNILWAPTMPPPGASISNITPLPMLQNPSHKVFGGPPLFNSRVPPPNIDFPISNWQPGIANNHNFGNNSLNLIRNPPPNFSPPGYSVHFPQMMSPNTPGPSLRPCIQPYPFPPDSPRVPGPVNIVPGHCPSFPKSENPWVSPRPTFPHPNSTVPGQRPSCPERGNPSIQSFPKCENPWTSPRPTFPHANNTVPGHLPPCPERGNPSIQSFPKCENPWVSPRPTFPHPNNTIPGHRPSCPEHGNPWMNSPPPPRGNNNFLPTSPFWIQRPPNDPSSSRLPFSPPFSASASQSYPPPQPFWPTQSRSQSNAPPSFNNFTSVHFNPNVPPPSPNSFNH